MATAPMKPFPVVLDLTDDQAYYVLTAALEEFASSAEHQAENEEQTARYNERPDDGQAAFFRRLAEIAKQLREDVERQLDEG
ncbi:hypothetical protein [Agromyces bauzanensis]